MTDRPPETKGSAMSHSENGKTMRSGVLTDLSRHKHSLLLGSLVLLLLLSPMIDDEGSGGVLLAGLFTLVLVAGTVVAGRHRRDLLVVLGLSVPWLYLTWLHPVWSGSLLDELAGILLAACTLYIAALTLRSVVAAEKVTHDIISGAIAVYLLMGIAWAVIFLLIEGFSPGSFALGGPEQGTIWDQLLYFSFTTLTTLGYGDIAPLVPVARLWTVLEAIFGTLFLAVLVSRLVGMYKS